MSIDRPGPVTLGDLADQGMDVWAWCNGCFKNGAVATDTLAGRDSVLALANWPRCNYAIPPRGLLLSVQKLICPSRPVETHRAPLAVLGSRGAGIGPKARQRLTSAQQ